MLNESDGKIHGDTQAAYVLPLAFDILPDKLRPLAAQHLAENIKAHDWHLTTGFVGVGYLCPTLSKFGHNESHIDYYYRTHIRHGVILLNITRPQFGSGGTGGPKRKDFKIRE